MNVEKIKELILLVEESAITSLELEESGIRIRIGKEEYSEGKRAQRSYDSKSRSEMVNEASFDEEKSGTTSVTGLKLIEKPADPDAFEVKSPMLGVYYSSSAPDTPPFVKTGDRVKKGNILCIIEAMKLMNEIAAEKDGEISEICIENGQIVEFAQTMFVMKK